MTAPFRGWIASTGTSSGLRAVLGSWDHGPFGRIDDVMVEHPDGRRVLYAPTAELAAEITDRYVFDDVVIGPVEVVRGRTTVIRAPGVDLTLCIGCRTAIGVALRLVPGAVRERAWWARACDPIARRLLPGVRTAVREGDRLLWYAASDQFRIVTAAGTVDGVDLGTIAPIDPPVRFGGSSAPRSPSLVRVASYRRDGRE